ncbi:RNA metabolism protein [Lithospermum erythrorhizon]|uniref:RNA-dependent RNA polymerase n=1 Tax=Lithospermum erythrorhizon TaxID=34254 RepID=A0AAV3R1D9_LITER
MEDTPTTLTVRVTNIPQTIVANDLCAFFESLIGISSVYACEIFTEHKDWKPKSHGRLQFETLDQKTLALNLSQQGNIIFKGSIISLSPSLNDIISRPVNPNNRLHHVSANSVLYTGFMIKDDCMCVLESWDSVKTWVFPERERIEFWFDHKRECYKLEFQFSDIFETCRCFFEGGKPNALLLKLKHAPKVYQKVSGSNVASKFSGNCSNRYHFCKEDFEFAWIRTTDFSRLNYIGHSSSLCLELDDKYLDLDVFDSLPFYERELIELTFDDRDEFCSASELVPLVNCRSDVKVAYEVLFQLNSLVHTHKISLAAIDQSFMEDISKLSVDTTLLVLQKMHKLQSTCYDPWAFIKMRLHVLGEHEKNLSSYDRLINQNIMSCHRVLITPTKIYCLGPELEASNYIVKNFAEYASDFIRVTFVEEDWSKLPANAVSSFVERGFFAKPYKTKIYHRILSVLRDGIPIGDKRFFFLAFSASQLRSNSVWMFSSNENVKVEDIRNWMGCFNKIRSVSKCAARMGQLFSASKQTYEVLPQHVELIQDIEVTSDGVDYCFSDGIGKISQFFARQVAQKCGLQHTPSAFQIRYGGYKGVIAVDRNSYWKLSLRSSMLKFESKNCMLNVTKCCESQPCYLNREIISLLSTLGVDDEAFLALQDNQLKMLDKMLTEKESALQVLESMGMNDTKSILAKMLGQGYEPSLEPYLSMMLRSHRENQVSDLRSRCRVFVQKGRVLLGCLDETGVLDYGQVYVRITLTRAELHCADQVFFRKVDDTTCIVIGKVLVTKNPCLHPGDVRVLEAVYEVTLEEKGIVDCVIFPQKGARPHPNECSGGDLDGDLYFISWDKTLIPQQTVAPMDYTGRQSHKMDHDVTQEVT